MLEDALGFLQAFNQAEKRHAAIKGQQMSHLGKWLEHNNKKLTDSEIDSLLAAYAADRVKALKPSHAVALALYDEWHQSTTESDCMPFRGWLMQCINAET